MTNANAETSTNAEKTCGQQTNKQTGQNNNYGHLEPVTIMKKSIPSTGPTDELDLAQ